MSSNLSLTVEQYAQMIQRGAFDHQCIHVFRSPRDGCFANRLVVKPGEFLKPLAPCTHPLDLADLFRS